MDGMALVPFWDIDMAVTEVEHAMKVLEPWGPDVQRKVMQDNAAALYHVAL